MRLSTLRSHRPVALAALGLLLAACSGGDAPTDTGNGSGTGVAASVAVAAGHGQTARIGSAVSEAPSVVVRDEQNRPVRGVNVTFSVAAGGGTVTGATATTDANGVARVGSWTLGAAPGANALVATAAGGQSPTVRIDATARPPRWTYMVYLAADNNLAIPGLQDLEEIESIITDPEIQVVVQAEFSPEHFAMQGLDPARVNLPNYNTFRFATRPDLPARLGPDGPVLDIGNRNLTDPAQLREFVTWTKATYPAERYALVLWNHGGGFTGLIEDVTSSGSHLMSLGDLPAALQGVGPIDVLNFDMCLMGAYETLQKIQGLARVAVFSQELEPGDGDPYDEILKALSQNPHVNARQLGQLIVDKYDASYAGDRASVTKSAYDMDAFAAFDQALGTLATSLTASLPTMGTSIRQAAAASQKYEYPFFTDLGDFLDSLRVRTPDAALRTQIDAVQQLGRGTAFRVATRARNGSDPEARPVHRSTGMHVTLPSGQYPDVLPDRGPGALAAYQALFPGKPWTQFLAAWVASGTTAGYFDQGEATRFEGYLVWSDAAAAQDVDIDLVILEPNGDVYVPFLGTVTPNGHLTGDSYDHGTSYEGYLTNRYVEAGRYVLYALLYDDPQNVRPQFDVMYRFDQRQSLTSLYEPDYPQLSSAVSWLDDPAFSMEKLDAGAYTDFQLAAFTTIGPNAVARLGGGTAGERPALSVQAPSAGRTSGAATGAAGAAPRITPQQAKALREAVRARRNGLAPNGAGLRRSGASAAPSASVAPRAGRATPPALRPRLGAPNGAGR